ncbi:MAG: hypothetical protein ACI9XR_001337 [Flavobacterium sp.]|jgi:hypothetical protein
MDCYEKLYEGSFEIVFWIFKTKKSEVLFYFGFFCFKTLSPKNTKVDLERSTNEVRCNFLSESLLQI